MFNKVLVFLFLIFIFPPFLSSHASAQIQKKRIGVLIAGEDPRYNETYKSFLEQLPLEGLLLENLDICVKNATSNKVRAMKMAGDLAAQNMDAYFGLGTIAAVALAEEIHEAPIVFGLIWDPVQSKIIKSLESSGNNLTGITNNVSMDTVLLTLKELIPIKSLAVFYTPGESNSEIQLASLQQAAGRNGLTVIPVPLSSDDNPAEMVAFVQRRVQAIYFSGSAIGQKIADAVAPATRAGLVTVSHLLHYVDQGMLLGVGGDPKQDGQQAAKMLAEVIKGARPSDMPVSKESQTDIVVNLKTLKALGLVMPQAFKQKVTRVIE